MSRRDKGRKHTYEDIAQGTRIYGRIQLPDPMDAYKLSYNYDPDFTRDDYFGTPKMKEWRKSHEEYIRSSDRILKIVKAYTYHGDRLANTYLRGVLSGLEDLMLSIRFSAEDVPIAYQIYDHYDFLKKHGIKMPEKEAMMKDDKLDMDVIRTFFDAHYRKLTNQFVLRRLLKSYTDDLQEIIKNAPKFGDKTKWAPLIAEGQVTLTAHAYVGVRGMPAKGGNPNMTIETFSDAVAYMANKAGGNWKTPDAKTLAAINKEIESRKSNMKH